MLKKQGAKLLTGILKGTWSRYQVVTFKVNAVFSMLLFVTNDGWKKSDRTDNLKIDV